MGGGGVVVCRVCPVLGVCVDSHETYDGAYLPLMFSEGRHMLLHCPVLGMFLYKSTDVKGEENF